MARQHGGELYDLSNMDDDEIRGLILQELRAQPNLDADWIDVDVKDGFVTLSGRVGTDGEQNVAESVVHDLLGVENYSNELVIDELHRGERSVAADEAAMEDDENDSQLGEGNEQQSDTAEHMQEQLEEETYGTHDPQAAVRDGTTYVPPDHPISDGYDSRENH